MQIVLSVPSLSMAKMGDDNYAVTLAEGEHTVQFSLSETALVAMGLECIKLCPAIEAESRLTGRNSAVRYLARGLLQLSDTDIQELLRECTPETLTKTLWFMRDADLIALVARNMSQRAADMALDDLETHTFSYRDPDASTVGKRALQDGRDATVEMVGLAARLGSEGRLAWGNLQ